MIAGPIGTGKSHLAIALGVEAARRRFRVLFVKAADLVRQLLEARDERELGRLQPRLRRVSLLVIPRTPSPFTAASAILLLYCPGGSKTDPLSDRPCALLGRACTRQRTEGFPWQPNRRNPAMRIDDDRNAT